MKLRLIPLIAFAILLMAEASAGAATQIADTTASKKSKNAQENKAQDLQELVVEGDLSSASVRGATYIPTTRQKRAAQSAGDLLLRMAVPQVNVDPLSLAITSATGSSLQLFIDHIPARPEDLAGLKTTDVVKVEYLEHPTDSRFMGAESVINFVMKKYEFGGYTKLSAGEYLLIGYQGDESLYSKYSYKRMTYDLYAGVTNYRKFHGGSSQSETFRITDAQGSLTTITRRSDQTRYRYFSDRWPVTFRATYQDDKVTFITHAAYTRYLMPVNISEGIIYPESGEGSPAKMEYARNADSRSNLLDYNVNLNADLTRGFSLNAYATLGYSNISASSLYGNSESLRIDNSYRENNLKGIAFLTISKNFSTGHSIDLFTTWSGYFDRVRYVAGDVTDYDRNSLEAQMSYSYFTRKWRFSATGGVSHAIHLTNGTRNTNTYPYAKLNATFSGDSRHLVMAQLRYSPQNLPANAESASVIRQNEYIYIGGNPSLQRGHFFDASLMYFGTPAKWLRVTATLATDQCRNTAMQYYLPYTGPDNTPGLLRTYVSDGYQQAYRASVDLTALLFRNSLILRAGGGYSFWMNTGMSRKAENGYHSSFSAMWYSGDFSVGVGGTTPARSVETFGKGVVIHRNGGYWLQGAWGNGKAQVSLALGNITSWDWEYERRHYSSPYYDYNSTVYNDNGHAWLRISATFTIGYGKELRRGNEVGSKGEVDKGALEVD